MAKTRILLDSNAYLRIADSFHPLLHESFGKPNYTLYLIKEFQKEFNKNPRLKNKFGWVNQPEFTENRQHRLRTTKSQKEQINLTYSYLWAHNISEGIGASRVDVKALAYGDVLGVPVITDDVDMTEIGEAFGIEIWGLLDLLKVVYNSKRIDLKDINALINYLDYLKDLPYPAFKTDVKKAFEDHYSSSPHTF
ncbi:MAG: DNA-binding protein [Proteobacteria bacterium]|nr:DNA-binding protein [Pseudomonadota bacterium]